MVEKEEKDRINEFKKFSTETVDNHLKLRKNVELNEIKLIETCEITKQCSQTIQVIKKEVAERTKATMDHIEQILRQFQREKSDLQTGNDKLRAKVDSCQQEQKEIMDSI